MFIASILDVIILFQLGYIVTFVALVFCITCYFALPKLIKMIIENNKTNEE